MQPGTAVPPLRVTFVHSPSPEHAANKDYGTRFMPVWVYTLAAHVPDDGRFEISLFDTRVRSFAAAPAAEVFLYSGINQDYTTLIETRSQLAARNPGAVHVLGGPIAWSFDQAGQTDQLAVFDHLFVGDGEDAIEPFLSALRSQRLGHEHVPVATPGDLLSPSWATPLPKIIKERRRFDVTRARVMHRGLLDATIRDYYGAVVEVSRGCPFLCEFCDIRILSDNNRPHNKPVSLIVEELENLHRHGVRQIILACDNIVGEPKWAESLADGIIEWRERTGAEVVFYTWATITIARMPAVLEKLRRAGVDLLFIGIESFSTNSLLETAKLQNTRGASLIDAIQTVHSYGFIVVAGLIIGFDSDGDDVFQLTLQGMLDSGLLSGDPSMLYALPGTPLYRRMAAAGRLRDLAETEGSRQKITTNMRYLAPAEFFISGWLQFREVAGSGRYNYLRLRRYFDTVRDSGNYIPLVGGGFGDPKMFVKAAVSSRQGRSLLVRRVAGFLRRPERIWWAAAGVLLGLRERRHIPGAFRYVTFWGFTWSNLMLNLDNLTQNDFSIESVDGPVTRAHVLPDGYDSIEGEDIPAAKSRAQRRSTIESLERLLRDRGLPEG
jgi:radical SAM superfamily enzyme YgiQ (UPF0313 family)